MVAGLLDDGFGAARFGRRQENSVGSAGNILFGPEDSDVRLDFVVIGRYVFVAERPIVSHAVMGADFEVHRRHAQRDASPVVGASADDARTEPAEFRPRCRNIRLAFDFPRAVGSEEFVFESLPRPASDASTAMRQIIRPDMFLEVSCRNQRRAGLEQRDLRPPSVSTLAAVPPEAPEPMMQTS